MWEVPVLDLSCSMKSDLDALWHDPVSSFRFLRYREHKANVGNDGLGNFRYVVGTCETEATSMNTHVQQEASDTEKAQLEIE